MAAEPDGPGGPGGAGPRRRRDEAEAASAALEEAVGLAFRVLQVVMVLLALGFLGSGLFTVAPHEVAYVARLGRLGDEAHGPGAHLAWPVIDQVARVDVGRATRVTVESLDLLRSARELAGAKVERGRGVDPAREGYVVTGDANLLHLALAARLGVASPRRTLLALAEPEAAVRCLLERAAVRAAAEAEVELLLGPGKGDFTAAVARGLQEGLLACDAGLEVQAVELERDVLAPPQVQDAFAAVLRAAQDRDKQRSEALAAASRLRGEALTEEARVRSAAAVEASRVRADAQAAAAELAAHLPERRRDPAGWERRMLAQALARALGGVEEAFLLTDGPLRLRLERDARALRAEVERAAWEREHGGR